MDWGPLEISQKYTVHQKKLRAALFDKLSAQYDMSIIEGMILNDQLMANEGLN